MRRSLRWRGIVIALVFGICLSVGIYPLVASGLGVRSPSWLIEKELKLGLDLRGGVHLVLRVQTDDALRLTSEQEMERLREEMKTRTITYTAMDTLDPIRFKVDGIQPAQDAAFRTAAGEVQTNFDR